jgi:signal transduction histidine kinase
VAQTPKTPCDRLPIEKNAPIGDVLGGIDQSSLHRNEKSELPWWAMVLSHWGTRDVVVSYPVTMQNENTEKGHILAMVVLSKAPSSLLDLVREEVNRAEIWLFSLILVLSLSIVTALVTLLITRPIQVVRVQMRRAKEGERGAVSRDLVSLVKILEQRENQTRDLAFHVAHQTRTPLTSTLVSIDLLRQHGEKMSLRDKEKFFSLIEKDARRLELMTDRLMELAKSERMVISESDEVIVEEVLRHLAKDTNLPRFSLHVESSAKGQSVGMEAQWIESIITDLINNAQEHGGEDVSIAITVGIAKYRDRLLTIRVHNDGQGISPIDKERVFDPFFTTSKNRANSGLGLAIVKAVLASHNGTIELIDTDSGVTFEIVVPIR